MNGDDEFMEVPLDGKREFTLVRMAEERERNFRNSNIDNTSIAPIFKMAGGYTVWKKVRTGPGDRDRERGESTAGSTPYQKLGAGAGPLETSPGEQLLGISPTPNGYGFRYVGSPVKKHRTPKMMATAPTSTENYGTTVMMGTDSASDDDAEEGWYSVGEHITMPERAYISPLIPHRGRECMNATGEEESWATR